MPYVSVTTHIANREPSKETAIESAVTAAQAANPGYEVNDVDVVAKPDGSYNVTITMYM